LVKSNEKNISTTYDKEFSVKLNQYNLFICKYCFERNFKFVKKKIVKYKTSVNIISSNKKECNVCKNLFKLTIYSIKNEIINSKHFKHDNNQNKTLDIGTVLPLQLFEKEDNLRSIFKIKGLPNIKHHYNSLIRKEIIKDTGFSIDHLNPYLRVEIFVDIKLNYEIKYKTKELVLLGRYNKFQRGLNQRIKINNMNNNEQIDLENPCSYPTTIEDIILNFLYTQSGSKDIKISWSGSEDKNSLVLGKGRPFIVKINNPQVREFQKIFHIKDKLSINFFEINTNDIKSYDKYRLKIKTLVKVIEEDLEKKDLEKEISKLIGETRFQVKNKIVKKYIYSSSYRTIDNKNFEMVLTLDNGIPIKQLIGGKEFIEPCLSKLINKKCECVFFDIDDVIPNSN
jgi:tRNA pseudouridine synthase 10